MPAICTKSPLDLTSQSVPIEVLSPWNTLCGLALRGSAVADWKSKEDTGAAGSPPPIRLRVSYLLGNKGKLVSNPLVMYRGSRKATERER